MPKQKGGRKLARTSRKAESYKRQLTRTARNKANKLRRHVKRHPNDKVARKVVTG